MEKGENGGTRKGVMFKIKRDPGRLFAAFRKYIPGRVWNKENSMSELRYIRAYGN